MADGHILQQICLHSVSINPLGGTMATFGAPLVPLAIAPGSMPVAPARPSVSAATSKTASATITNAQQTRREKAKLHARKCREKKKHEFENLQEEERLLREENQRLRALVRSRLPDQAQKIVSECCYSSERVKHLNPYIQQTEEEAAASSGGGGGTAAELARSDFDLIESLAAGRQSFVLTDPRLPDNPIVYCSDAFCELTGYKREQVIGRNCRFLQTPETDPGAVDAVRRAIDSGSDATTVMLNAKADGATFWNRFFVAALRDRHRRIVNFVGVQTETDEPKAETRDVDTSMGAQIEKPSTATPALDIKRIPNTSTAAGSSSGVVDIEVSPLPISAPIEPRKARIHGERVSFGDSDDEDDQLGDFDWTTLAEALEKDYAEEDEEHQWGDRWIKLDDDNTTSSAVSSAALDRQLLDFVKRPRLFTTKVVRSEVIHTLLSSYGDMTDPSFTAALDVLSSIYRSSGVNACSKKTYLHLLNGSWRSLSRPAYQGCLGMKNDGSFCYTLQTMSFGMFRPGNLRCSVQNTLTHISSADTSTDGSPTIAPWSLRRELAVLNETNDDKSDGSGQKYSMLKAYDIAISLTIEPAEDSKGPSPTAPIRALKVVKGYMLPDPNVPNRLTIWFVGGRLSPVVQNPEGVEGKEGDATLYGGLEEWKALFGREQKKTWGESFRDMGAKLLLGAELPAGMSADGKLSYQLHRPHGGHGVAYLDVLYYDEHVLITRGNRGTIYVMSRDEDASLPPIDTTKRITETKQAEKMPSTKKKRKGSDIENGVTEKQSSKKHRTTETSERAILSPPPPPVKVSTVLPPNTTSASAAAAQENFCDVSSFLPIENHNNKQDIIPQTQQLQQNNDGGVRNILQSVEAFFSWGATQ